jgi:DNA-binding protein YbaB
MTSASGLGDFIRDPDEAQRRIDQWAQGFAAKAERYQAAQARTEQLRLTAASGDGAVRVTVGADGAVTDLVFSNKARSFPLEELSAQILSTMRRAQAGIASRVGEVMAEQLGDEDPQTRSLVLDNLRSRFPDPDVDPEEEPPSAPDPAPGPDATTPPPTAQGPARRRPEAPESDDDNSPW